MNRPNTNNLSSYIPEPSNNNQLLTGYPLLAKQQQQQQQPAQISIMNNNATPLYHQDNNTPLLMSNMNMPIIDESGAMKRFNVNATRSNSSSSSTSSSVMSSLSMYRNKFNNEFNDSDSELLDLKHRNDLSKLFEDDIFYCPRSLLSQHDIQRSERLLSEERLNYNNPYSNNINSNNNPIIESPLLNMVNMHSTKFNPYTSKSFNPSSF